MKCREEAKAAGKDYVEECQDYFKVWKDDGEDSVCVRGRGEYFV